MIREVKFLFLSVQKLLMLKFIFFGFQIFKQRMREPKSKLVTFYFRNTQSSQGFLFFFTKTSCPQKHLDLRQRVWGMTECKEPRIIFKQCLVQGFVVVVVLLKKSVSQKISCYFNQNNYLWFAVLIALRLMCFK